ncbi:S8 family peptidase [Clostridium sp.]|uniref:S8 family peptidase n=1 Tax=Clostridium sp. TaxID=1506 RepID=UPI002FCB16B3
MKHSDLDYQPNIFRELGVPEVNNLPLQSFEEYYLSEDYETYFIDYVGDIKAAIDNVDYAQVFISDKFFAILFVRKGMLSTLLENVREITSIERNLVYTLSELVINNEVTSPEIIYESSIPLDGEGVIVGIIGTGIDYLNPRFMTETGESRIISIWDQTIRTGPSPQDIPFGTVYNKDNINEAIRANTIGGASYEIVPHKDEVGHGTAIAGLIGGRSLDELVKLNSVVPKCEFAIVKLEEPKADYLESIGIEKGTKNVYQTTAITSALKYLSDLQASLKKPMVVYLPLGSNFGGRDGNTILERYIDNITNKRDFSVVTDTGNQGRGYTHTSGEISETGEIGEIFINVGVGQTSLALAIYTKRPDSISIGITSPSGNSITGISTPSESGQIQYLTREENGITVEYLIEEELSGTISINIVIKNTMEGIWKISLFGKSIVSGMYDCWLPHLELLKGGTRVLIPDPYTTLLTPGTSLNIISTAYYNEMNNTIVENSGRGFPRYGIIEPSFSTGGINLLTVGLNNSLIIGSGSAMAGSILAGAVALIYQWGNVKGNYPQLSPPTIKNILIGSTDKDENVIYPDRQWGYGRLNINKLHEIMITISNNNNSMVNDNNSSNTKDNNTNTNNNSRAAKSYVKDESTSYLYINIPFEVYKRINNKYRK